MAHSPPQPSMRTTAGTGGLNIKPCVLLVIALTFVFLVLLATSPSSGAHRSMFLSALLLPYDSTRPHRIGYRLPDHVDNMLCEDPKRSSTFSRETSYYRDPKNELCLVPLPGDFKIPVRWPENLEKIGRSLRHACIIRQW